MTTDDSEWTLRDVGYGLMFLGIGGLLLAVAWITPKEAPFVGLLRAGWLLGPLFLLLGINATLRSLAAPFRSPPDEVDP